MDSPSLRNSEGKGEKALGRLTQEDKETITTLYQTHPTLWPHFESIVTFLDLHHEDSTAYRKLLVSLVKINDIFSSPTWEKDIIAVSRFAVAVGFVETSSDIIHRIMSERSIEYFTEFQHPYPETDVDLNLLVILRSCLHNFAYNGAEIRHRLLQSGLLKDMLEDIKHMEHLTGEALEEGGVYGQSLGTIQNCCKDPKIIPKLREMGLVETIVPFQTKQHPYVRALAFMTLGYVLDQTEVDIVRLDPENLQYFLDMIRKYITNPKQAPERFGLEELLYGLSRLARNVHNERLMVATGTVKLLVTVLEKDYEEEAQSAAAAVAELAKDQENVKVFKRDGRLVSALGKLRNCGNETSRRLASEVLLLVEKERSYDPYEDAVDSPLVAELLGDNSNALAILGVGEVEYLLDQLSTTSTQGQSQSHQSQGSDSSPAQLMRVLAEMAKVDNRRREILARGGLDLLATHLQRGSDEEQKEALCVVRELATCEEYSSVIQAHGVMQLIQNLNCSHVATVSRMALSTRQSIEKQLKKEH